MEPNKLLEILNDYNFWGNFSKKLLDREGYRLLLKQNLKTNTVNIIKGIRRAGKSSIILKLIEETKMEKDSLIINLEDPRFPLSIDSNLLMEALEVYNTYVNPKGPKLVVIDEVQHANKWERFARYLIESKSIKCIVTGSSSQLLGEEVATTITGRHIDLEVFPLSFKEFLLFNGIFINTPLKLIKNRFSIINMLNNYLKYGGFPEPTLATTTDTKFNLLKNYFNDILVKDIAKRYKIRHISQLEAIANDYLSNIGTILSFRKISKSYDISLHTVERFSKYFSDTYLFFLLDKFSFSKRKQNRSMKKVYTIDLGFYNYLGFKFMEQEGKIMENTVAIELMRNKIQNVYMVYYWQDYQHHEVDFVIKKFEKVSQLIQVTYASSKEGIKIREIDNLIIASKELNCQNLLCITWNYEAIECIKDKKIEFVPLWKWLLR